MTWEATWAASRRFPRLYRRECGAMVAIDRRDLASLVPRADGCRLFLASVLVPIFSPATVLWPSASLHALSTSRAWSLCCTLCVSCNHLSPVEHTG